MNLRMRVGRRELVACVVLGFVASSPGCRSTLPSSWRDRDVTIDGDNSEWSGVLQTFEQEQIDLGLFNDEQYLYVNVCVGSRMQQAQILAQGCTFWFDASGEKQQTFGIHYPFGLADETRRSFIRAMMDGASVDSLVRAHHLPGEEIEVVGAGESTTRRLPNGTSGIEIALRPYSGSLICELRVPLVVNEETPYAIGGIPGRRISVGIETPEMTRPGGERPDGGFGGRGGGSGRGGPGPGGGGAGGPGGGRGGPGGPGGPGGGFPGRGPSGGTGGHMGPPQALKLWAEVELAKPIATDRGR